MQTLVALAALASAVSAIQLTIAWRDWPPEGIEADRPLARTLTAALGWAVLAMAMIFSVRLLGVVWPTTALALIWGGLALARRRVSLVRFYRLALPLGLAGMVCVLLLFQGVFGDSDFGLFRIFPPGG